jgi:hypothetical protein
VAKAPFSSPRPSSEVDRRQGACGRVLFRRSLVTVLRCFPASVFSIEVSMAHWRWPRAATWSFTPLERARVAKLHRRNGACPHGRAKRRQCGHLQRLHRHAGLVTAAGGHAGTTAFGSDALAVGQQLNASSQQYLHSYDGRYGLLMQSDGTVVLYGPGYHVLWSHHNDGATLLVMQADGNLVLYRGSPSAGHDQ